NPHSQKDSVQTLLDLGATLAQCGDPAGAAAALRTVTGPIKAMPEGRERTLATRQLAERFALAGQADEAIALAFGLQAKPEGASGIKVRSCALNPIASYLATSGNLPKAIEAARGIQDKDLGASALSTIAAAQVEQGDAATAMRTVDSIEAPAARIRALVGVSW